MIDRLASEITALWSRLNRYRSIKNITFPRYMPDTQPIGIEGQSIIGDDDIIYAWKDGAWVISAQ